MPIVSRTTVTTSRATAGGGSTGVAVHTISFRGLAGAIFIVLLIAVVLYVMAFATTGWTVERGWHRGLWEACRCGSAGVNEDWFRAVQAMIVIGLIGLFAALVVICLYMCVHSVSKNRTLLALTIICFISVVFMLIGFIVYGTKATSVSWSFALAVIASILCLVAGVLSLVQMRQSGLA